MTRFWVGGYGSDMDGDAEGIGFLAVDEGRGPTTLAYRGVAAPVASPSWLAPHPVLDIVYAALEGAGSVQAFARTDAATLRPLGDPVPAGEAVCHLSVSPDGRMLIASCYGDGRVVRYGLDRDGRIVPAQADAAAALRTALFGGDTGEDGDDGTDAARPGAGAAASDPYPVPAGEDPRSSHAHAAVFLPDGRIATTDLGFDLVRIWRPSGAGLAIDHEVALPRGTGPRHMVLHPSGHLHVVTEYSCEVFTLASGPDGRWDLVGATTVTPIAQIGADFPAELARSRDGATLYTALRGSNTLAALRVRGSGETLEPFAVTESGVDWPRHHLVYDGTLLVSGQRSNTVAVVDLDERTGAPRDVRHVATVPTPTQVLPVR
ncbi:MULTISPECIES: lactonase family protein [Microbacterium]|uniref:lactonase family protein n=1 Tax=Microbacterium TaxID=33882 RepID=UPI00217E9A0E|nr:MULTISPECIES: lactonase family protein [Microbacterium]UWF77591.1 beta-propeller fold lactonase family protein [Microbacterium neungamense]WCM55762.1 beta-propeller fold lactonase family protein [Microbacterium sp. EF45047]